MYIIGEDGLMGCLSYILLRDLGGADTWDLAWNGQYQLVSVSTNGAFAEAYAYDALGRRVTTRNAEGTERHVYDDNWQVVADLDEDGNVIRSYVWGEGIDRLLAVRIGSHAYTALTDVQGTVWGYADEGENVVAKWTYDAWGNVLSEEVDASATELRVVRYRFQGRERSAATGLTNFRMRWYDAITGRWLSKDPIGLSGGLNLYAFCAGDPLGCCDPDGLIAIPLPIILPALQIGVVIGLAYYGSEVATELVLYFSKKLIDTATISLPKGGHTKNMRPSNREKHQKGDTRRQNDQRRSRRLNGGKSFPFPMDFSNDDDDCR